MRGGVRLTLVLAFGAYRVAISGATLALLLCVDSAQGTTVIPSLFPDAEFGPTSIADAISIRIQLTPENSTAIAETQSQRIDGTSPGVLLWDSSDPAFAEIAALLTDRVEHIFAMNFTTAEHPKPADVGIHDLSWWGDLSGSEITRIEFHHESADEAGEFIFHPELHGTIVPEPRTASLVGLGLLTLALGKFMGGRRSGRVAGPARRASGAS